MMFDIHDLQFQYTRSVDLTLDLPGVFNIPPGKTIVILGESGSGKSTLLSLLSLIWDRPPLSGKIIYHPGIDRLPITIAEAGQMIPARMRSLLRLTEFGFVPQASYLLPHISGAANVSLPFRWLANYESDLNYRISYLFKAANLDQVIQSRKARDLSGGQRQRIAILRAIVNDPQVVFADEPISNLDRMNTNSILELLQNWKSGELSLNSDRQDRSLLLVSHSIAPIRPYVDFFVVMFKGRLVRGQNGLFFNPDTDESVLNHAIETGENLFSLMSDK